MNDPQVTLPSQTVATYPYYGNNPQQNHQRCECHECTQARWKSSIRGQIESACKRG